MCWCLHYLHALFACMCLCNCTTPLTPTTITSKSTSPHSTLSIISCLCNLFPKHGFLQREAEAAGVALPIHSEQVRGCSRSPLRDSPIYKCTEFLSLSLLLRVVIFTAVCAPPSNTTSSKMPAIKRESSPEPPLAGIGAAESSSHPGGIQCIQIIADCCDVKSSLPPPDTNTNPYIVAKQNQLRPGAYQGSSPRKYKLAALGTIRSHLSVPAVSVFSRLPSRLGSAIATGRVNKTTAATTSFHTIVPQHPGSKHPAKHVEHTRHAPRKNRERMDESMVGSGAGFMDGSGFGTFPPMGSSGMLVSVMTHWRRTLIMRRASRSNDHCAAFGA
jgi:hypothetical protein